MKYRGKRPVGRNIVTLVIPRPDENIAFILEAVESFDRLEKLCPFPEAPEIIRPGNVKEKLTKDPAYLKRIDEYAELRSHFMAIESMRATKDLEWETVDFDEPSTWKNWTEELKEAGFVELEISRIIQHIAQANCLDQNMLDDARATFLHDQALLKESSSQTDAPETT